MSGTAAYDYVIRAEGAPVFAALRELQLLIPALADGLRQPVCQFLHDLRERRGMHRNVVTAVEAPHIDVVVEPSAILLELLAALRTGDGDAIGRIVHGGPLQGG